MIILYSQPLGIDRSVYQQQQQQQQQEQQPQQQQQQQKQQKQNWKFNSSTLDGSNRLTALKLQFFESKTALAFP